MTRRLLETAEEMSLGGLVLLSGWQALVPVPGVWLGTRVCVPRTPDGEPSRQLRTVCPFPS